jgi:hypothetical protein
VLQSFSFLERICRFSRKLNIKLRYSSLVGFSPLGIFFAILKISKIFLFFVNNLQKKTIFVKHNSQIFCKEYKINTSPKIASKCLYRWSRDTSFKPLTHLCLGSPNIVEPKSVKFALQTFSYKCCFSLCCKTALKTQIGN